MLTLYLVNKQVSHFQNLESIIMQSVQYFDFCKKKNIHIVEAHLVALHQITGYYKLQINTSTFKLRRSDCKCTVDPRITVMSHYFVEQTHDFFIYNNHFASCMSVKPCPFDPCQYNKTWLSPKPNYKKVQKMAREILKLIIFIKKETCSVFTLKQCFYNSIETWETCFLLKSHHNTNS